MEPMELEKSQTWKNLESSLSQEAVAYCEYTFYGQQAAKDGYKQISDIFNETAGNELHHAKLHYKKMHGGKVPGTMEELLKLPGVGRKSANLMLGDVFHVAMPRPLVRRASPIWPISSRAWPPSRRAMRTAISCSSSASRTTRCSAARK